MCCVGVGTSVYMSKGGVTSMRGCSVCHSVH